MNSYGLRLWLQIVLSIVSFGQIMYNFADVADAAVPLSPLSPIYYCLVYYTLYYNTRTHVRTYMMWDHRLIYVRESQLPSQLVSMCHASKVVICCSLSLSFLPFSFPPSFLPSFPFSCLPTRSALYAITLLRQYQSYHHLLAGSKHGVSREILIILCGKKPSSSSSKNEQPFSFLPSCCSLFVILL